MPTITGPKVQVPSALTPVTDEAGALRLEWQTFMHSVQQIVFASTRSGPTASRPTNRLDGRWVGMQYFDTTLGKTIYLKSIVPDVWVDGSGSVV